MAKVKSRLETKSQRKARLNGYDNGRERNAAYTSGAREVGFPKDPKALNAEAWENGTQVQTYTSSKSGRMSDNGRTAGGYTHSFTKKDDDGNVEKQSGRGGVASRRQRYYDIRVGLGLSGG